MTLSGLLLLAALGQPYFTRPATPAEDLARLQAEVAQGQPRIEDWRARLQLYIALGELQKIPELVELMAKTFPDDPAFQEGQMMFLSLQERHPEAIAQGEKILAEHPEYAPIWTNLGRVYLLAKNRARGVNLLLAALERGPLRVEEWELLLTRGLGLELENLDAPANTAVLATLKEKVAKHPERPGLKYLLMVVLTRLGRYPEAHQILASAPDLLAHPEMRHYFEFTEPVAAAAAKP